MTLPSDHVGFAYNTGETVLKDVSLPQKQGEVTALVGAFLVVAKQRFPGWQQDSGM